MIVKRAQKFIDVFYWEVIGEGGTIRTNMLYPYMSLFDTAMDKLRLIIGYFRQALVSVAFLYYIQLMLTCLQKALFPGFTSSHT